MRSRRIICFVLIAIFISCTSKRNDKTLLPESPPFHEQFKMDFRQDSLFELYEHGENDYKQILNWLVENSQEHNILVDIWGTWCKPCIVDFKFGKESKKTLSQSHRIKYVYFCTSKSSNKEKWSSMVKELEIQGQHFFIDEAIIEKYRQN